MGFKMGRSNPNTNVLGTFFCLDLYIFQGGGGFFKFFCLKIEKSVTTGSVNSKPCYTFFKNGT